MTGEGMAGFERKSILPGLQEPVGQEMRQGKPLWLNLRVGLKEHVEQEAGFCCCQGNNKVLQSWFLPRLLTSNKVLSVNSPLYCSAT